MATSQLAFDMPVAILIADSNKSYREITRKMLTFYDSSYIVDSCATIAECLEMVDGKIYDIVLANENFDDGNNYSLLSGLRQKECDIPVLMLFEEGHENEAANAQSKGAIDYIIKSRGYLTALPFTVKKILEGKKDTAHHPAAEMPDVDDTGIAFSQKGYFILNHKGRFISANPGMESVCGYSEDELLELSLLDLLPKGKEWDLFDWLHAIETNASKDSFAVDIVVKYGTRIPVSLKLTPVNDAQNQLKSYRGELVEVQKDPRPESGVNVLKSTDVIESLWGLSNKCSGSALPELLTGIGELSCQLFNMQRATVALLDRDERVFNKVAMVGHSIQTQSERQGLAVPGAVISKIFEDNNRIKILYHNEDQRVGHNNASLLRAEQKSQTRDKDFKWDVRDVVVLNLCGQDTQIFGYISLDQPLEGFVPTRTFFENLEVFTRLASLIIEKHVAAQEKDQRNRRLSQVLVTSNIFKLYLSMHELLKEVVWSIKFSLDFNVVALALISEKSGQAEIKAVACEDKIKGKQIASLKMSIDDLKCLFDTKYKVGKSYLIEDKLKALSRFKQIYYGNRYRRKAGSEWLEDTALIAALRSRNGKVMGIIIVDDPVDGSIPDEEYVRTLEILANQVSVAIDNRVLYVDARRQPQPRPARETLVAPQRKPNRMQAYAAPQGNFWKKFFKS